MVAVPTGVGFLEQATRAKRELILILAEAVEEEKKKYFRAIQVVIKAAADEGLVDLEVLESENKIENTSNTATEDTQTEVEVIERENNCFLCGSA